MEETTMQEAVVPREKKKVGFFALLTFGLILLLPVLRIPSVIFPLDFTKATLALIVVAVLFGMFFVRGVRSGVFRFRWSPLIIATWVVPLVYLVSAVFSSAPSMSFFGYQLEIDTFGFMVLLAALVTALALTLERENLPGAFSAFLFGAWIVFAFQAMQVFLHTPFPFAALSDSTANLIGRWNDLGVFAGLVASLTLFAYPSMRLKPRGKVLAAITFAVALFFMMLSNLVEVWALFGLIALTFSLTVIGELKRSRVSSLMTVRAALPLIGLVASIVFVFWGSSLAAPLQNALGVASLEVRPSVGATISIVEEVYKDHLFTGSGPNTFAAEWLLYRPDGVLSTVFWNTSFNVGSGTIPTAFATGGIIVALGWIIFTLLSLYTAFLALTAAPVDARSYTFSILSGLGFLYLLIMHYVYAPGEALTLLMGVFLALFIVSLTGTPLVKEVAFKSGENPRRRSIMFVVAALVIIVSVGAVYGVSRTYASVLFHGRAIQVANNGDLDRSATLLKTALTLRDQDRYLRTGALIAIAQLNAIVQNNDATDTALAAFQEKLTMAIKYTNDAVTKNPRSFENQLVRASVYAAVVPLGVEGGAENAITALENARPLSPKSPEIDYRLAQINTTLSANQLAQENLKAAIAKKPNYTDAILLLARIELAQGNLTDAIDSVKSAVYFEPQNPVLLYQLGILLLQNRAYADAASAFEGALQYQADYANAAFFLAQSYAFLGRYSDAAALMGKLETTNPDNQYLGAYQQALEQGVNPFDATDIASPEEGSSIE